MAKLYPRHWGKILYEITDQKTGRELAAAVEAFITMLKRKRVFKKMDQIISAFTEYSNERAGIRTVRLTTARPAAKSVLKLIETKLKANRIVETVDESIIGGAVVRIGDTVIDGSIKMSLVQLRNHLNQ